MSYSNLTISAYVIAAICGCWTRESGVNPAVWESLVPCAWDYEYEYTNKGGYGLGQWTNVGTSHGRLWNLHTWVNANGYADGDGYGQLEYMLVENHWKNTPSPRLGYRTLTQFLQSPSNNINDLVYDFLACWEGVEGDHYAERCGYASDAFNHIMQHAGDGNTYNWIATNNYLSSAQTLNNVMVVYNYMNGGTVTGNTIYVNVTGNGTAYVDNQHPEDGEDFTLYAIPATGETLVQPDGITATDANGYSIAMEQTDEYTYTYNSGWGRYIYISVEFTGTTPPYIPTVRKKMPLWMMVNRRRDYIFQLY